ncbi:hypothetical protein [Candidatus Deianiraea vastatrix]|uniref:Uncharacterized protein n=1 Tax=Candidatus Deianiraea vastatrix TaxID=2163644 RepID=A0A5B8XDR9_9RICK|nr:hypothetical protein [Candidatus Deianiraea vastatrix]QED23499.1 hypothetical protein Deia_00708 [Candidatus Deianiraea vastatrix]
MESKILQEPILQDPDLVVGQLKEDLKKITASNDEFIQQNNILQREEFIKLIKNDKVKQEEVRTRIKQLEEMQKRINEFNTKNPSKQINGNGIDRFTTSYKDAINQALNPNNKPKDPKVDDESQDDEKLKLDFDNDKDYEETLDNIDNQPPIEIKKGHNDAPDEPKKTFWDKAKPLAITAGKILLVIATLGGSIAGISIGSAMLTSVVAGGIIIGPIVASIGLLLFAGIGLYVISKLNEKWKDGTEKTIERGQTKRREHQQSIDKAIKNVKWHGNQREILNKIEKDLKADLKYQGKLEEKIKKIDKEIKKMESSKKPLTEKQQMELNKLKFDRADLEEKLNVVKILNHYRNTGEDINIHPKTISIDPSKQNNQKEIRIQPESTLNNKPQAPVQPKDQQQPQAPVQQPTERMLKMDFDDNSINDEMNYQDQRKNPQSNPQPEHLYDASTIETENSSQEMPKSHIPLNVGKKAQEIAQGIHQKPYISKVAHPSQGSQISQVH